jgi:DHA3 family tetracycline resistance protein-like MFS transporter
MSQQEAEGYLLPPVRQVSVLGSRDFRLLWTGQTVSAIGDQIFPIAVALKVVHAGGSPGDLGVVLLGRALAMVLFLVVGGVYADRIARTRIMIGADAIRAVAVLGLALSPAKVPVLLLAGLMFVVGGGEAFFRPAYGAVLPSVLPADQLPRANAATSVSLKTALIFGPAIAGVLVATTGTGVALGVDAATFLVSMLTLLRISEPPLARREVAQSPLRDALEGVAAVRARPWVTAVLVMATLHLMLAIAPMIVLEPFIARERLGGDGAYATLIVAFAVGGVLGALLPIRLRPRRPGLVGLLGLLPHVGLFLALARSDSLAVVMAWNFVCGIGVEPCGIWWISALQREIPRDLLARVTSLDWLVSMGLMPLGFALTGPAAAAFGRTAVLYVAAATILVTTLGVLAVPGVMEFATPQGARTRPD